MSVLEWSQSSKGKRAISAVSSALLFTIGILVLSGVLISLSDFGGMPDGANIRTITLVSASLYSGIPTNTTDRGTSALSLVFNNPGEPTYINSIAVYGSDVSSPITVYQCMNSTYCVGLTSALLPSGTVPFDTNATAFYLSSALVAGQVNNYVIDFSNSQGLSGSLVAQSGFNGSLFYPSYPSGFVSSSSSSASSACTSPPYPTTLTEHFGNDYATTLEITTISCEMAAQSAIVSESETACTSSPYITTETVNSSDNFYTTIVTAYC
ncbi:MAG: hypothetical protein ACREBS_09415 [Nitrososphaerales archaeon]